MKDLFDRWKTLFEETPEIIRGHLLLVDIVVPLEEIRGWELWKKVLALSYAEAAHLSASDNVLSPYCVAHLEGFPWPDDESLTDRERRCICVPMRPRFLEDYLKAESVTDEVLHT